MHIITGNNKLKPGTGKHGKGFSSSPMSQGRIESPGNRVRSPKGRSPGRGQGKGTYCTLCDGTETVLRICPVCAMCIECFGDEELKDLTASTEPGTCFLCAVSIH